MASAMLPDDEDLEELVIWADQSEYRLKTYGIGFDPPEGIFDYPDLLARGWGWNRLVTSESSPDDMPTYKNYLKDFYIRNTAESVAQAWQIEPDANTTYNGTGLGTSLLATLAKSCIEAEEKFISKREGYEQDLYPDEINLSKEIQQCVRHFVCLDGEFPVAATALMFITKEAELMCQWLEYETYDSDHKWCATINIARRCALDLMLYKGPESFCLAGLMMGIAMETKTLCEIMRQDPRVSKSGFSIAIILDGWDVLEMIHDEIFSDSQDGAIPKISTVGELISKENDGKDSCKTKAGDDVNSANPSTHPQANADVDSANPKAPLDGASVNGSDCIKDSLEVAANLKIAKNQVEKNGKTAKHKLKLYGDKAVRTKNYLDALKLYTQAIQMDSDDATLYSKRSLCHLQISEANKALLDANSCIKIRPEFVKGYYWKGVALMSLKEYKEACDAFLAGLKLDPTNVDMERKFREAIEAMKKDYIIHRTSTTNYRNWHDLRALCCHFV